jgi:hypothetical protein
MGQWRYSSIILELCPRRRWVVSLTSRPLYPTGNNSRCQLDRRLVEHQNRSGRCGEEENLLSLPGIESGHPDRSHSLYRLSYPDPHLAWQYILYIHLGKKVIQRCVRTNTALPRTRAFLSVQQNTASEKWLVNSALSGFRNFNFSVIYNNRWFTAKQDYHFDAVLGAYPLHRHRKRSIVHWFQAFCGNLYLTNIQFFMGSFIYEI